MWTSLVFVLLPYGNGDYCTSCILDATAHVSLFRVNLSPELAHLSQSSKKRSGVSLKREASTPPFLYFGIAQTALPAKFPICE